MNISRWKYFLFSFLIALSLLGCLEVLSRVRYYQKYGQYPLALQGNIVAIKNIIAKSVAEKRMKQTVEELEQMGLQADENRGLAPQEIRMQLVQALYSEHGRELLEKFRREYEESFAKFVQNAQEMQTKLCVLYIPENNYRYARLPNRAFYRELAERYQVDYLDCTEEFLRYPVEWITLLPENGHLSRFGNQIVVEKVAAYIDQHSAYRTTVTFQQRPKLFGDLKPTQNRTWNVMPDMPYQVIANSQGLRMNYELTFPKQQQRILILGDSYTFGPYLPNFHCYPNLLDAKYSDKEVINAGIAGYTITDELGLFTERAKYVEPDITILQVLENDIEGMFYFLKNEFSREKGVFTPSPEEKRLMQQLSGT